MNALLSRGELRDLTPHHWLDDMPGWNCAICNADKAEDEQAFPHPDKRWTCLQVCKACHKVEQPLSAPVTAGFKTSRVGLNGTAGAV